MAAGGGTNLSLGVSGSAGLIEGLYLGNGIPTPLNFCGPGTSESFSSNDFSLPIGFTHSEWVGLDKFDNKLWQGNSAGINISIELKDNPIPIGINLVKVITFLHFPSYDRTLQSTKDILKNDSYYEGK